MIYGPISDLLFLSVENSEVNIKNTMTKKPAVPKGIKRKKLVDDGDTDMSSDDNIVLSKRKITTKKKRCLRGDTQKKKSVEDSDDDFVKTPPISIKKPAPNQKYFRFSGQRILPRCSLANLTHWIATFSDAQKKTVVEMGFGSMLDLKLESVPTAMGFWLVQNYNHQNSTLHIGTKVVRITPELVHEVLGIPIGKKEVMDRRSTAKNEVITEWKQQFPGPDKWVLRPFVLGFFERVSGNKDAGRCFSLNFLVGFFTIIGETNKNSVVNLRFLSSISRNTIIKDLRWCDYLIHCLNRTRSTWTPDTKFNGPIILLAVTFSKIPLLNNVE